MKILLVEDSARLRDTLARALGRMGHAVDLAENGEDGELMARQNDYDVVVLDRMLPGKDGLKVLTCSSWNRFHSKKTWKAS